MSIEAAIHIDMETLVVMNGFQTREENEIRCNVQFARTPFDTRNPSPSCSE